ncbi:MAG: lysozyme inhibitor LprI family protein, partial [Nostoc sp.]
MNYLILSSVDKKLNRVYQQLLSTLESSRKQKLIAAQVIWIKFRDTN